MSFRFALTLDPSEELSLTGINEYGGSNVGTSTAGGSRPPLNSTATANVAAGPLTTVATTTVATPTTAATSTVTPDNGRVAVAAGAPNRNGQWLMRRSPSPANPDTGDVTILDYDVPMDA